MIAELEAFVLGMMGWPVQLYLMMIVVLLLFIWLDMPRRRDL